MSIRTTGSAGFALIGIIVVVTAIALVGGIGFAVYNKSTSNKESATVTPTATPPAKELVMPPYAEPEVEKESGKYVIAELGIAFTVPDFMKDDLIYVVKDIELSNDKTIKAAYFSTKKIAKADAKCSAEFSTLGALSLNSGQYPSNDENVFLDYGRLVKQFPDAFVSFAKGGAGCSAKPEVAQLNAEAQAAFSEAIATVELTQ